MRLSRLVWSPYETPADRRSERDLLGRLVDVVDDGQDAEILVTTSNLAVSAALLNRFPASRLVVTTTSGYDHVDLAVCRQRGIAVARLAQARRDAVVEVALGLLLRGLHRLGSLRARALQGTWARAELPSLAPRTLAGARVGVIGMGVIGCRMAQVLRVLGAEVWGYDPAGLPPGVRTAEPQEMVARCDAISLHCSLTDSSHGLVDATMLLPAHQLVLVNTSRGPVVDVDAAVAALDRGQLSFLGLDVFPLEPWPDLHAVASRPELVLLPHAAGYHRDLSSAVRHGLELAVSHFLRGIGLPHQLT